MVWEHTHTPAVPPVPQGSIVLPHCQSQSDGKGGGVGSDVGGGGGLLVGRGVGADVGGGVGCWDGRRVGLRVGGSVDAVVGTTDGTQSPEGQSQQE